MNNRTPWCLLVICLILVTCKTDVQPEDQLAVHIPENSVFVLSISPERIMEKSDYEQVKEYGVFSDIFKKIQDSIPIFAELLETPRKSGIDFSRNTYFFILNNPKRKRQFIVSLMMPLTDASKFESLVTASANVPIQSDATFQYIQPEKGESVIAWNKEKAMIFGVSRGRRDQQVIADIFNLNEDASLASNAAFAKGFRGDHDLKTFINSTPFVANLPPGYLLAPSLAGISKEALMGNYSFGSWDFEKGHMDGTFNYVIKSELTKHYSIFFKDELKTDFSQLIPSEGLSAVNTYALNLKGIHQGLVEKGVINMTNAYLKNSNLEFKDVANAFDGDVSMAIYTRNEGEQKEYLGITNVENDKVLDQLLAFGVKTNKLNRINKNLYSSIETQGEENPFNARFYGGITSEFQLLKKGKSLYYSSDKALIQLIQSGKFKPLSQSNPEVQKALMTGVAGFYSDFQNGPFKQLMDFKELDYVIGSSDREKGTVEVKLFKENENSLKSIIQSMEERYQNKQKRKNGNSEI